MTEPAMYPLVVLRCPACRCRNRQGDSAAKGRARRPTVCAECTIIRAPRPGGFDEPEEPEPGAGRPIPGPA
ncbi:hypothetical protein FDG2_2148 [Candidatus Protofrankia californiensis]|uniref:Uncharacterized protein n=1 Tax=Candidatus Protofrankia californiensis TaxID=1839754 RepID=A0A1C3NX25_9ACTN|nr:hypothetical protein FDG2_2148 [Candidatus Protofrankia californiensis]